MARTGEVSSRGAQLLQHRWFLAALVAVGSLLALPSLGSGFVADDYIFINRLEHEARPPTWQLYEFLTGAPGQHTTLMTKDWVAFPWWLADELKVRFLRPLSSGLFALDHELFAHAPLGYHAHCLLWYALLLLAVGLLLKAACASPTWQIAFALFAVSASHAEAVAWISSRHMLVSTAPALFGLLAIVRHREAGFRPGQALGLLGMALGLLGGEAALSVVCYWLAYEAFGALEATSLRSRVARLGPPLILLGGYLALYKWLGYGAAQSGAYLDPISTPRAFFSALPARLAMLLAELFTSLPSGLSATTLPGPATLLGAVSTLGVLLVLRSIWPRVSGQDRRALRFLAAGAGLSLLVNAGALLGPRLVLIPGIGAFVAIALVLRCAWPEPQRPRSASAIGFVRRALFVTFALVHVLLAPIGLVLNCHLIGQLGAASRRIDASLDRHLAARRARGGLAPDVFVLAASDPFAGFYAAAVRGTREPATGPWSILSMARARHRIERTAPNELRIHADPSLLRSSFEVLFRSPDLPLRVGQRAELSRGFVTVLELEAGLPSSIALTLTRGSFDDPDVCLLAWREQRLVPVQLAVNESLDLPWSAGPTGLL